MLIPTTVMQRISFFAVRIFLGVISTLCEAALYRAVVEKINERVGRYLFFMLLFSAGMWNSATGKSLSDFVALRTKTKLNPGSCFFLAFLPSSFAMYATMLASAYAMEPATVRNKRRTLVATVSFATGAIVGWPFALALSIPFVIEELFVLGGDKVLPELRSSWMASRWKNFATAALAASLIFVRMRVVVVVHIRYLQS
jgi:alpha-1,2-mannosyltransferase